MRRSIAAVVTGLGLLWAGGASAAPGAPDLAGCPKLKPFEATNDRTKPLPVSRDFTSIVSSSRDQFAVATIYGGTVCVDTRDMTETGRFTISSDRRFLEFDWTGYEADGHVVVDRTGAGQWFDTGAEPVSSPKGSRFAAVQQSEAAFGSLEGFGVWQVGTVGTRRIALREDIPSLYDWRIDGWVGEDCINLSGIPHARVPDQRSKAKVARDRYVATAAQGWAVRPSPTGCPTVKPAK